MAEELIEVKCTIELMGKPKEAVMDSLKKIISNIEENGNKLEVSEIEYADPNEVKDGFFSSFARFKIKGNVVDLLGFVMDYAPSSIELLTTRDTKISMTDLQALMNDLSGRMSEMDQRIKIFSGQTVLLSQQLDQLKKEMKKTNNV
jgi:hypothetical protein